MGSRCNFAMIVNNQDKYCMLPIVYLTQVMNFGVIGQQCLKKRRECYFKKVNHYHEIIKETVRPNVNSITEIA